MSESKQPDMDLCACGEEADMGDVCSDCWPGYNLCADPKCEHYRCEHFDNPSDGCGNADCPCKGFVEGSSKRIVTKAEFRQIVKYWEETGQIKKGTR